MSRFYGEENASPAVRALYEDFLHVWSAETCAPRMRAEWTPENPTLGQCSITSFLVQDLLGGKVYGIALPEGGVHCFNEVGGVRFDLTSGQFGGRALCYENTPEQTREVHFADEDKHRRYELLKERLRAYRAKE